MKIKIISIIIFSMLISPIFGVEIQTSIDTGNFAFKSSGELTKKIPNFGFTLALKEELDDHLRGSLGIKRIPGFGNTIWGKITYVTEFMHISIGPTLGFFNTDSAKKDFITIFQPGIGTSLYFQTPIGLMAKVDSNFALPLVKVKNKTIYLQDGIFEFGWKFPNIIASLAVAQTNKTAVKNNEEIYVSITDMGFYTISYSKPSRFKIPLNILYRISRFEAIGSSEIKKEIGSVVIQTGITHSINSGIEWYLEFGASVYSFNLKEKSKPVKKFFFDASAGIKFSID